MTQSRLDEILAQLPTLAQTRTSDFIGWRGVFEEVRRFVQALPEAEQQKTYEQAMELYNEIPRVFDYSHIGLWFFAHPSFELFQAFMAHTDLQQAFADHVHIVARATKFGGDFSRKRYKIIRRGMGRGKKAETLAPEYAKLLKRIHPHLKMYSSAKRAQDFQIWLQLEPDPQRANQFVAAAVQEIRKQLIAEAEVIVGFNRREKSERLYQLMRSEKQVAVPVDVRGFVEKLKLRITSIKMVATPLPPAQNQKLCSVLVGKYRSGQWPRFVVNSETLRTVSVKHSSVEVEIESGWQDRLRNSFCELVATREYLFGCKSGLLSVGLKIHVLKDMTPPELRSLEHYTETGFFRALGAERSFNLPPFGSVDTLLKALSLIEEGCGVSFRNNPEHYALQVCSPFVLTQAHAAVLGVCAYLGGSYLNRYKKEDFITSHPSETGNRLVILGAGKCERNFDWWGKDTTTGKPEIRQLDDLNLGENARTDVLMCYTDWDIRLVNLVATLMAHKQNDGFFGDLGNQFAEDVHTLLRRHGLAHVLDVQWLYDGTTESTPAFWTALEELMDYAFADRERILKARKNDDEYAAHTGIQFEMGDLIQRYQQEVELISSNQTKGDS